MRHVNIPVFIPHLGCPNDCVFCNQRVISGHQFFDEGAVAGQIEEAASTLKPGDEAEIAFFGGSFTGIDRDLMIRLLEISDRYLENGTVQSVRCSTRPDYIDGEILRILKEHNVKTVELGIQSMSDGVLSACRRGHTAECSRRACAAVKAGGFSLIGQMMVGLPGATGDDEVRTAEEICAMGADGARVYPTVVFRKTELCHMAEEGKYIPLDNETAARRTAEVLKIFYAHSLPVIRVGLCSGENLSSPEEVYGGASHPAIGELAMGEIFFDRECGEIRRVCEGRGSSPCTAVIYVPKGCASMAAGQHRSNSRRIIGLFSTVYGINRVKILENNELLGYNIKINIL